MLLRDARPSDAAGIAVIYNDAVAHTTAIWNETIVDAANRTAWLADRQDAGYPVIVAVDDADEVIGYASYGPWRAFDGYRHTVEHSVYVRADQRGSGIGEALLRAIVARAREAGLHVMIGAVEAGNAASVRLHRKVGFTETGTLREVGAKFGTWLDLTFLQLILDERPTPG